MGIEQSASRRFSLKPQHGLAPHTTTLRPRTIISKLAVDDENDALRGEASERALRQSSPRLQWWPPICADMGGLFSTLMQLGCGESFVLDAYGRVTFSVTFASFGNIDTPNTRGLETFGSASA